MANRKLTDLPELLTADIGDFFYIVDVSDTTESPQGTGKKIKRQNTVSSIDVIDDEYIYTSGDPEFTLPVGAKISQVAWNGAILRRADWSVISGKLVINFTPTSGDVFQPIGIK